MTKPKGTSSGNREGSLDKEEPQETRSQGDKRIRYLEGSGQENQGSPGAPETRPETRPGKKRREESPGQSQIKWRLRPTFLAPGGREVNQETMEGNGQKTEGRREPETEPELTEEKETDTEEVQV